MCCSNNKELNILLRKGDNRAYHQIFDLYYSDLYNYASRIISDKYLLDDTVQDVFVNLYKNRDKIKLDVSLKAYLYKSTYNHCIDIIRHNNIQARYLDGEVMDFYLSEMMRDPEVITKLKDEDIKIAIDNALNKLPPKCREIFRLKKIEGYSGSEISKKLNISLKTVESQMTIAYSRLRKDLKWLLFFIISI